MSCSVGGRVRDLKVSRCVPIIADVSISSSMPAAASPSLVASRAHEPADRPGKARVLCVDDEPLVLESLRDSLRRRFEIVVMTNGFEALRRLTEQPFHVVLSDMRMPLLDGARFLTLARKHAPDTVRVLLTGQATLDDAVAAVNDGEIFRLLVKPCPQEVLVAALESAAARHETLLRERALDEQAVGGVVSALTQTAAAVDPDAPARAVAMHRQAVELARAANVSAPSDEIERACQLLQVGVVSLRSEVRTHLAHGRRLGAEQAAELERLPELAERLVVLVPRLAPAAALLSAIARPWAPTRGGEPGVPPASSILRIVFDFYVLEAQGVPATQALQKMHVRGGYDTALLKAFAGLQDIA